MVLAGAVWGAIPVKGRPPAEVWNAPDKRELAGTVLQWGGLLVITAFLDSGPLRPSLAEMAAAILFTPLGAVLFLSSVFAARRARGGGVLIQGGIYRRVRHPMYLAFLLLLLGTAMLASAGWRTLAALLLYIAGTEMRIAAEETSAGVRLPEYETYRSQTRWLYLPGIR